MRQIPSLRLWSWRSRRTTPKNQLHKLTSGQASSFIITKQKKKRTETEEKQTIQQNTHVRYTYVGKQASVAWRWSHITGWKHHLHAQEHFYLSGGHRRSGKLNCTRVVLDWKIHDRRPRDMSRRALRPRCIHLRWCVRTEPSRGPRRLCRAAPKPMPETGEAKMIVTWGRWCYEGGRRQHVWFGVIFNRIYDRVSNGFIYFKCKGTRNFLMESIFVSLWGWAKYR